MTSVARSLISSFVHNPVFANLLALGTMVAGTVAVFKLPRETFPETSVDYLLITVAYPGATPLDVEQSVCIKVEEAIEGIAGIWEVSSLSEEDVCNVAAAFHPEVTPAGEVLRQVQNRINGITTFPPEVERPVVVELIVRNTVIAVGVHGDAPERTIKHVAEQIRDELLAHPLISQVQVSGVRDYEMAIRVSEEALQAHSLTIQDVISAVSRNSLDVPAGTVRTRREEINVRTVGQRQTVRDFEELVVLSQPDGAVVRLGQMATVRDAFEETPIFGRINGQRGARIEIAKTSGEDISEIARVVREYVNHIRTRLPEGLSVTLMSDRARDVDGRLNMLVTNGLQGVALLMICLLFFMDFRSAMGVAMGVPVATAGALWVLQVTGSTLNMISLFGLIMADSIVLDDSIVIAEGIHAREKSGATPALAAIEGTHRVAKPVFNASLTTIIMFIPLMFVEGVMGKLIFVLPIAVIATIVASAVEAFLILPVHMYEWSTAGKQEQVSGWRVRVRRRLNDAVERAISRLYGPLIRRLARGRFIVLAGAVALVLFCAGLVWGGRTPFVLFPKIDGNTIRARIRFPGGTPIEVTRATIDRIEQAAFSLNARPELRPWSEGTLVQNVYSVEGEWSDFIPKRGSGLGETTLELMPSELRRVDCADIISGWREAIGAIPGVEALSITREELGPTEKPIEIQLRGQELDLLRKAADEVNEKLTSFRGVFDVDDELVPGKRELRINLRPEATTLGLTVADLAAQLRQGLYGGEAVRIQRGQDEVKAIVSYEEGERRSLSAVENLRIRTRTGAEVPFHEVAETELIRSYSAISRQDGSRRVRIHADVDERHANAEQVVTELATGFLPALTARHPGISYRIDGQRARIQESMRSLLRASVVALLMTYAILGASLRSYAQPMILIAAVPLGMCGSVLGHYLMGFDLSLMSVFGMTALAGIVVNDGLVLLDQLNENVSRGMEVEPAVIQAAESRVLAVFLTALTNVAGLAPMLTERSSQAQPLIPIAISVTFGLTFSTVLILMLVPAMYLVLNDLKRCVRWLRLGGTFPSREEVEKDEHHHGAVVTAV